MHLLIVPGINGSGPEHWQSIWETELGADRFRPASWNSPEQADWLRALDMASQQDTILIAHSLGCLAVTSWLAAQHRPSARGAFLVAPPDSTKEAFPHAAASFTTTHETMPVPSIVVASGNDPYADKEATRHLATLWGADYVNVGDHGHLNEHSGLGRWDAGIDHLTTFIERITT